MQEIRYNNKRRTLQGFTTNTFWYGGNLIVVEVKREGEGGSGEGQLLAYMAMVHDARKNDKKASYTVYGLLTDSWSFNFYCLGNKSTYSSRSLKWGQGEGCQEIPYFVSK